MTGFEQSDAQLAVVVQEQFALRAAIDAGELWMDAGARCDQAVRELDDWLIRARELTVRRKFGDNEDGNAAAERFVQAGHEFIATIRNARQVFANMADTFRAAGRTMAEADQAGQQMFRGKPE